jgi:gamma-glutamylcyclotransferase (GGCT)/AIG2-like uncharacterized protein YtfP
MTDFLFVYGTLLPGRAPDHLREIAARLKPFAPGCMPGRLFNLGNFPGAVFDAAAATRVYGEVLELPNDGELHSRLDDYEDFSPAEPSRSIFIRERLPIMLSGGAQLLCWVYVYNRDPGDAPLIPGGDYSAWISRQHASQS